MGDLIVQIIAYHVRFLTMVWKKPNSVICDSRYIGVSKAISKTLLCILNVTISVILFVIYNVSAVLDEWRPPVSDFPAIDCLKNRGKIDHKQVGKISCYRIICSVYSYVLCATRKIKQSISDEQLRRRFLNS